MTYNASEVSQASGQPVELYQFTRSGLPLTGALIAEERWEYADQTARNVVWPKSSSGAAAYSGGDLGGHDGLPLHMGVINSGLGGFAQHGPRTWGPSDGLAPSTTYRLFQHISLSRPLGVIDNCGISINGGEALNPHNMGLGLTGTIVTDVTTDGSGEFTTTLGHFGLEFGMEGIVILFGPIAITAAVPAEADAVDVHYTSAYTEITYDGDVYEPAIITRGDYDIGGQEHGDADLELRLTHAHEVSAWFAPGQDQRPVTVTMYRLHRSDLTDERTPEIAQIVGVRFEGVTCVLTCSPRGIRQLARETPRQRFSIGCNHVLYGSGCGLLKVFFTLFEAEVTAISGDGLTVTVDGVATYATTTRAIEGCFVRGLLTPRVGTAQTILDQSGDDLVLLRPITGLEVGSIVDVTEGCSHTVESCNTQFGNLPRYGGYPGIPLRNPFDPSGRGLG
jgi:hypothetical protein